MRERSTGKGLRGSLARLTIVIALTLPAAVPAGAAVINACGPNVCYQYDDAQAAVALTGTPVLVGDDMQFLPPAFLAQATGVAGWVTTTANFIFSRIYTVDSANEFSSFHVFEEFDYEIITDGEVRAALYTQARSNLLSSDSTSTLVNWSDSGDTAGPQIDSINAYLYPADAFSAPARDMRVSIQNTIRAFTDALAENAFIQKKFTLVALTTQPAAVPVPAAVWLFGSALGLLGWLRRGAAQPSQA
ncbi:MAG: hypothetical protein L6Q83_03150 [Gammaproteobacteria bacterium]|nr:hypothetical protein [Gammaproteobacteria bacterium]